MVRRRSSITTGVAGSPARFTGALKRHRIRISMDCKRHWVDNLFVERLWCSGKCKEVY